MSSLQRVVKLKNLGRLPFMKAWKIQKQVEQQHLREMKGEQVVGEDTLLIVEHQPVYTIGIRDKMYSAEDETRLRALGAEFVRTNRGGLITFHGPGQLVAYPILNLRRYRKSMRWYVSHLEECIINLCTKYNLKAHTSPDTGVWIQDNKVAAIGIHGSRFITTHGIAINCCTDLQWYLHIVPCGIPDKGVTSLSKELGYKVTVEDVLPDFCQAFSEQFNCEIVGDFDVVSYN